MPLLPQLKGSTSAHLNARATNPRKLQAPLGSTSYSSVPWERNVVQISQEKVTPPKRCHGYLSWEGGFCQTSSQSEGPAAYKAGRSLTFGMEPTPVVHCTDRCGAACAPAAPPSPEAVMLPPPRSQHPAPKPLAAP